MTVTAAGTPASTDPSAPRTASGVRRASALWVLIAGAVGLTAAITLTVEKVKLLENPAYVPSCSINPVLSCGSVMVTPQAAEFGFPNSLIGVVAFSVVLVAGVLAVAKVPLPQWFWVGLAAGTALGVVFVHWLIYQSLYTIGALCPYCMVVWAVVVPVAFYVTSFNLRAGLLGGAAARSRAVRMVAESHVLVLAVVLVLVLALVLHRFWSYWVTVL